MMKILKNIFYKNKEKSKQAKRLEEWEWVVEPNKEIILINLTKLIKQRRKLKNKKEYQNCHKKKMLKF